jgi:hypothetical protein
MTDELTCPICKTRAEPLDKVSIADGFECGNHGRFRVASSVLDTPALMQAPSERWEQALAWAKRRQLGEWAPTITTYDFEVGSPAPGA